MVLTSFASLMRLTRKPLPTGKPPEGAAMESASCEVASTKLTRIWLFTGRTERSYYKSFSIM